MIRAKESWLLATTLALCLAAAAEDAPRTPRGIAPPTRIPDPVLTPLQPAGTPVVTAEIPRTVRRAVVADAARRFAVAESAVVLSVAEQVTWPDGALGCPEPGRSYLQSLVPGYRVVATTPAGVLRYHTDARANVVTCGMPVRGTRAGGAEPRTQPPPKVTPDR
jgi:hypothetical protein